MKKWTLVLIVLVALAPTTLFGQAQTTGSVTGTVTSEAGTPVADAEITLTSPAIQGDRVTRTGASGQFNSRLLPRPIHRHRQLPGPAAGGVELPRARR